MSMLLYCYILRVFVLFLSIIYTVKCFDCQRAKGGYHGHSKSLSGEYNYKEFQPFQKIERELHRIENSTFSSNLFSIGCTFEGRQLWTIKFHRLTRHIRKKQTIVVDCGAHAREWLAPSTCMYLIKEFSKASDSIKISDLTKSLQMYDWVFIPLLNPDGYAYTWLNRSTRLWRKNRSYTNEQLRLREKNKDELCIGVDVNRNFDKTWGGPGAPVNNPCYEMYAGSKAFSERESTALAKYLNSTQNDVIAYISLHTFGQSWMTPWGFTKKKPKRYKEMIRVAKIAVESMKNFSGVEYSFGTSYDEIYPNSGSSTDWAYSEVNIPYSYCIEMIPKKGNQSSHMLCPTCMMQNARDILVGLKTMSEELIDPYLSLVTNGL